MHVSLGLCYLSLQSRVVSLLLLGGAQAHLWLGRVPKAESVSGGPGGWFPGLSLGWVCLWGSFGVEGERGESLERASGSSLKWVFHRVLYALILMGTELPMVLARSCVRNTITTATKIGARKQLTGLLLSALTQKGAGTELAKPLKKVK